MSDRTTDSSIVRLGGGFSEEADRRLIESTHSQLLARAASSGRLWDMEISVKDREGPGQYVTLEAWVRGNHTSGNDHFVATSQLENLRDALNDVASDVLRQFTKARDRATPRANRHKRETIRG